jgi:TolA-binding protein
VTEVEPPNEEGARSLGRLPRLLEGGVSESEHAAGRERLLLSFGSERSARLRWLVAALVVAMAAAVAIVVLRQPARLDYRVSGPLVAEGEWLGVAQDRGPLSLTFSEGTEMELGPGSKGRVTDVTGEGARVVLGTGLLHARVVHRARTHWTVVAGPYSIEVTGTAFDVGWSTGGERLELTLHDGSVVVRGPSLHDGIRVAAGQCLVAHARTGGAELSSLFAAEAAVDLPAKAPDAAPAEPVASAEEPQPSPRSGAAWSELLAAGNFRGVLAAAEARGIDATLNRGSLADLGALADAARYAHDRGLAKRGLLAERTRFPASEQARAAAFLLGRMADATGSQSDALHWYDEYLSESPHGSFAAEALGRKLVALVRAGAAKDAQAAAKAYLERFPRGAHAAYAREVLSAP